MTHDPELRAFPRVAAAADVTFAALPMDRRSRRYLDSIARDVSLGGMFLVTGSTFRRGTVLQLSFVVPGDETAGPVRARAVVRWRRWWRRPRGMGVQFVEFEGLGREQLTEWLRRLLPDAPARASGARVDTPAPRQ